MSEITPTKLPQYVHQYTPAASGADQPAPGRSATASAAISLDFQFPGKYDAFKVERELYTRLNGQVTKDAITQFFTAANVQFVDLDALVQGALSGDTESLHKEMEAQTHAGVIHFLTVGNESKLMETTTGVQIHNWPGAGQPVSLVRLGFSDTDGYGLYFDPAAPQFNVATSATSTGQASQYAPLKIGWQSILDAQIVTCLAIMPPQVPAPPPGFSFQSGQWPPAPPAQMDASKAEQLLQAIIQECQARDLAMQNFVTSNKAIADAATAMHAEISKSK